MVSLCANCHCEKHPELPRGLFFNKNNQPYWHNKSAASLAREIGVSSRTVIRKAANLKINRGHLNKKDEQILRKSIGIGAMTSTNVALELGISLFQLNLRIERGVLPHVVKTGGWRRFDDRWLERARKIMNRN
jgi:hypothetical protein